MADTARIPSKGEILGALQIGNARYQEDSWDHPGKKSDEYKAEAILGFLNANKASTPPPSNVRMLIGEAKLYASEGGLTHISGILEQALAAMKSDGAPLPDGAAGERWPGELQSLRAQNEYLARQLKQHAAKPPYGVIEPQDIVREGKSALEWILGKDSVGDKYNHVLEALSQKLHGKVYAQASAAPAKVREAVEGLPRYRHRSGDGAMVPKGDGAYLLREDVLAALPS